MQPNDKNILKYDFVSTRDLEHSYIFKVSPNGKIAFVSVRDRGGVIQIDLKNKKISQSYILSGKYIKGICFKDNYEFLAGSNDGVLTLINCDRKEVINKRKISETTIMDVVFSANKKIIFAITAKELFSIDSNTLSIISKVVLDFRPWDLLVIPKTDLLLASGSKNKIDLYRCVKGELLYINSVICGSPNKEVVSITYDDKNSIVVSGTESGFLDFWLVTLKEIIRINRIEIGDNIYHIKCVNDYLAFSTTKYGCYIYKHSDNELINIKNTVSESKISLEIIDSRYYLAYYKNNNVNILDINNKKNKKYIILNLPDKTSDVHLSKNGDIVCPSPKGVVISNILNLEKNISKKTTGNIDFYILNKKNDTAILKYKDRSMKIISLTDMSISNIQFEYSNYEVKDFSGDSILLKNNGLLVVTNGTDCTFRKKSSLYFRLLNEDKYFIINSQSIDIYNFNEKIKSISENTKNKNYFFDNDCLIRATSDRNSKIINLQTGCIDYFDIGYAFDKNSMIFSDNKKYILHFCLNEIKCFDLSKKNKLKPKMLWSIKDPFLYESYPIGFNKLDSKFYIYSENMKRLITVSAENSNMLDAFKLPSGIENIKLTSSGTHIIYKTISSDIFVLSYPFSEIKVLKTRKWKTQIENTKENEILLKVGKDNIADFWLYLYDKLNSLVFSSSHSGNHQLNPMDYSLRIPKLSYLDNYNASTAISIFLNERTKSYTGNKEVSIIFHEIFHVFQSNTTKNVFDYFYLIDELQQKRIYLLKCLGDINYFELFESNKYLVKSIFHCIENYNINSMSLLKELSEEILEKSIADFKDDISHRTESLVNQYGENLRGEITKKSNNALENFIIKNNSMINENLNKIKEYAISLNDFSDLSMDSIKKLIKYFTNFGDLDLHVFNLIEGSAEIFGLCCGGYDLNKELKKRKTNNESDVYIKSYMVFIEHGGKTPVIFIILSILSLKYGEDSFGTKSPVEIFYWGLKRIKYWEDDFSSIKKNNISYYDFKNKVYETIDKIENSISSIVSKAQGKSIHDKEKSFSNDNDSPFFQGIFNIRKDLPSSSSLYFIVDIILNKNTTNILASNFRNYKKENKYTLRKNEVMRDFEKFLIFDSGFTIYCCQKHGAIDPFENNGFNWDECDNDDSFLNILSKEFSISLPKQILDNL